MRRLLLFFVLAFVHVVILGTLFPDTLMEGPSVDERYITKQGADVVAIVRDGCPHCAAFEAYATKQGWDVEFHEITNIDTPKLFEKIQKRAPTLQQGVPTIIINGQIVQGYETDEKTGTQLKKMLESCRASDSGCKPFTEFLASDVTVEDRSAAEGTCTEHCEADLDKYVWDLPILGRIDLTLLSLPALLILLGFLDGFNPCAMWVLITLLTLLISTSDMRKVLVIGGTFVFVRGAIYYLFIAAWLNVFLLIGLNLIVQKIIGLVAVCGGAFYLYEAFGKNPNECKVTNMKQRQRTVVKMKHILEVSAWPAMILGVAILAVSVNSIELVCTAGLPAIFTQILAFNEVSHIARYGYMALYILLYMVDDIIIFAIAVYTLQ